MLLFNCFTIFKSLNSSIPFPILFFINLYISQDFKPKPPYASPTPPLTSPPHFPSRLPNTTPHVFLIQDSPASLALLDIIEFPPTRCRSGSVFRASVMAIPPRVTQTLVSALVAKTTPLEITVACVLMGTMEILPMDSHVRIAPVRYQLKGMCSEHVTTILPPVCFNLL